MVGGGRPPAPSGRSSVSAAGSSSCPMLTLGLRPAAARGRRRLADRGHRDQQRRGGRLSRAPRREPAARDDPRAVHRDRRARRRLDRVPARRAAPVAPVRRPAPVRGRDDGAGRVPVGPGRERRRRRSRPGRGRRTGRQPGDDRPSSAWSGCPVPGYQVRRLGLGIVGATVAGVVSALLGIGGGIIKVPLMHLAMGVPFRVATATSNMMIGITAAASAVIYLIRGGIDPYVAGPTAIGVFLGATAGSRLAHRVDLAFFGSCSWSSWSSWRSRCSAGGSDDGVRTRAVAGTPERPVAHRRSRTSRSGCWSSASC